MSKRFTVLAFALVLLLALTACQNVQPPPAPVLAGTNWILSSLSGSLPLPGTTITLQYGADGTAAGTDGCNRYNTTYVQDGYNLSFAQPMAATMVACPGAVMGQAANYMEALAATTKFEAEGQQLTLFDGRNVLATFVAERQNLQGTSWQVVGYNNGSGGVVSVKVGSTITADFSATEITGNASCNDYFTSYQASGSSFSVGPIGSTRKACQSPPGIMTQEQQYLTALESAAAFSIEGNQLRLLTSDGATAVQYTLERNVSVPEPEPGQPTGRVTAPGGANVRSGPGTNYPILGVAPLGTEGQIVGRSPDFQWWAVALPSAPGSIGWVSDTVVATVNVEDVPVIQPSPPPYVPPAPVEPPTPVPAPTATPVSEISFWADQTTIDQGQCTNLNWSVENVQAVWVYPQGQPYERYPRTGQGSEQVCPDSSTTYEMRVLKRDGSVETRQVSIIVNVVNPLADTSWEVISYNNGRGGVVSVLIDTRISARFGGDNQVAGNAGCNDYNGSYQVSGASISFGPLASTQKACGEPEGIMQQESEYLAALQSATSFLLDGNRLEMRDGSGATAVTFSR